eukprot:440165_1
MAGDVVLDTHAQTNYGSGGTVLENAPPFVTQRSVRVPTLLFILVGSACIVVTATGYILYVSIWPECQASFRTVIFCSAALPDTSTRFLFVLGAQLVIAASILFVIGALWHRGMGTAPRGTGFAAFRVPIIDAVMVASLIILLVAWTMAFLINTWVFFIRNISYLFCLFVLLSNAVYLKLLSIIIKKLVPRGTLTMDTDTLLYIVHTHWTILHVCGALLARLFSKATDSFRTIPTADEYSDFLQASFRESSFFCMVSCFNYPWTPNISINSSRHTAQKISLVD